MLYTGCSGWFYEHWTGKFYPADLDKGKWLEYYSKKFNSVEINTTFYNFPTDKILKSWGKRTPEGFKLSLKVPRIISHEKNFEGTEELVDRFYSLAARLGDKLGCLLFQLRGETERNLKTLGKIINQMNPEFNNVIEFRHASWWDEQVYDLMRENNIAFCMESYVGLPEDEVVTSKNAYMRLHGVPRTYASAYSDEYLKKLAARVKKMKAHDKWVYFNNDLEGHAPQDCFRFMKFAGVKR